MTKEKAEQLGIELATIDEIAQRSDFVTVHTPLTPKTKVLSMLISFNQAKPKLQIINVARGGIINENDLLNALTKGIIENYCNSSFRCIYD